MATKSNEVYLSFFNKSKDELKKIQTLDLSYTEQVNDEDSQATDPSETLNCLLEDEFDKFCSQLKLCENVLCIDFSGQNLEDISKENLLKLYNVLKNNIKLEYLFYNDRTVIYSPLESLFDLVSSLGINPTEKQLGIGEIQAKTFIEVRDILVYPYYRNWEEFIFEGNNSRYFGGELEPLIFSKHQDVQNDEDDDNPSKSTLKRKYDESDDSERGSVKRQKK